MRAEYDRNLELEHQIDLIDTSTTVHESSSYPGLIAFYTVHTFNTILGEQEFNPEGYIEEQEDKTTYFIWEEINEKI